MTKMISTLSESASVPPRLSIIIATWNAAKTFERCLRSIIGQEFTKWELLIADGASTDGTTELIRRYEPYIRWWESRKDGGIYDAWNKSLAYAQGDYVCFLGADDAWHTPSTLRKLFEAIGDVEYDLVTGLGALVDSGGRPYHEFGNAWDYKRVMKRMTICHPGALHRRKLFEHYGKFDTSYRICADYDFLLRLPAGLRSQHVDMIFVDVADGGISRERRWLMLRERYRAQANCPHVGRIRASFNYVDKLWRIPVAKALGIPN